jgi:outer membrane protein
MKKSLAPRICLALVLAAASAGAFAQQSPWMLRARAVHLDSANGDSTGLGLSVNDKWLPEADVTYFINRNVAAELVLTVPQKHTLSSFGARIGSLRHLPPTLTVQYHFMPDGAVRPYVGAGLNYTRFSSVSLPVGVSIERSSFGGALQAGLDVPVAKSWSVNFDVKKVWIRTDVSAAGARIGTFKVDPLLVGVGVGYRF